MGFRMPLLVHSRSSSGAGVKHNCRPRTDARMCIKANVGSAHLVGMLLSLTVESPRAVHQNKERFRSVTSERGKSYNTYCFITVQERFGPYYESHKSPC